MSVKEAKSEFIRAQKSLKSADVLLHTGFYEDARECVSDAGEFLAAIKNYLREQGVDFGIEQK